MAGWPDIVLPPEQHECPGRACNMTYTASPRPVGLATIEGSNHACCIGDIGHAFLANKVDCPTAGLQCNGLSNRWIAMQWLLTFLGCNVHAQPVGNWARRDRGTHITPSEGEGRQGFVIRGTGSCCGRCDVHALGDSECGIQQIQRKPCTCTFGQEFQDVSCDSSKCAMDAVTDPEDADAAYREQELHGQV